MGVLALLKPKFEDRALNIALGLSALSWAVFGFLKADPEARYTLVRLCITALNACVGGLFIGRDMAVKYASPRAFLFCLPSLMASGAALKLAPAAQLWPPGASLLFCAGTLFTIIALLSLGKCFGLLPAARGLKTRGPFRWIRHPAYAGELVMLIACAWAGEKPALGFVIALCALAFLSLRIRIEETLLSQTFAEYNEYKERVKYRLLPYIW